MLEYFWIKSTNEKHIWRLNQLFKNSHED